MRKWFGHKLYSLGLLLAGYTPSRCIVIEAPVGEITPLLCKLVRSFENEWPDGVAAWIPDALDDAWDAFAEEAARERERESLYPAS